MITMCIHTLTLVYLCTVDHLKFEANANHGKFLSGYDKLTILILYIRHPDQRNLSRPMPWVVYVITCTIDGSVFRASITIR